jgi:sugar phosphate isomerase/epimerase
MQYGAQLYTVKDFTQNKDDLKSTVKTIAEIGYQNIQVSGVGNIAPEEIKSVADFYGLNIVVNAYYKFIKDFEPASKLIAENGLKLHYHNHAFEFQRYGNKTGYDILIEETDPSLFGFILDTYWVQVGGKNPADMIEKLKGRIDCIHFKDLNIKNNEQCMTEVMEGNLDWNHIIRACENTGISYSLVEQDNNWTVDPFKSLETSYNNLMCRGS